MTAGLQSGFARDLVDGLVAAIGADAHGSKGPVHAVVSPGSRNTPVVLALEAAARQDQLKLHVALDERSAAFMALGLARAGGQPVLLSCTSGSAGAHYLPAFVEAAASRVPLVAMTADRPPELQGVGAPQTIQQSGLFGPHVRGAFEAPVPDAKTAAGYVQTLAAQVVDAAAGREPGPVHLNLPFRKPLWEPGLVPAAAQRAVPRVIRGQAYLDDDTLEHVVKRLTQHQRGVIVCGPDTPASAMSVRAAAQTLGWPVIAEPASRVRFGSGPNGVRCADWLLGVPAFAAEHRPDLVLRLGRHPTSKHVGQWLARHRSDVGPEVILVDPHGGWHDPDHLATALVVAEPDQVLAAAAAQVLRRDEAWLAAWKKADEAACAVVDRHTRDFAWEGGAWRAVLEALSEVDAQLHVASSLAIRDLDRVAAPTSMAAGLNGCAVWSSRGANGIDGTLATAWGEAVATELPTVVVLGDLALLHDAGSLALSHMPGPPLAIVVLDNGGGGIFDHLPIAQHETAFEPCFATPPEVELEAVAAGFGVPASTVESPEELEEGLLEALEGQGWSLWRVPIDRAASLEAREALSAEVATLCGGQA